MLIRNKLRELDESMDYLFIKYSMKQIHEKWFITYNIKKLQKNITKEFGFNYIKLRNQDFIDMYIWLNAVHPEYTCLDIAKAIGISRTTLLNLLHKNKFKRISRGIYIR